ncbi:UNVERIFIED_CONTAM: site-specific recombinase XerD [Brevibacillus sp. OAP136]
MPIRKELKIDIQEFCTELGIPLSDLLSLVNNVQNTQDLIEQYTVKQLLEQYKDHLYQLHSFEKRSQTTLRYYSYFIDRLQKFILKRNIFSINDLNEKLLLEFLNESSCKEIKPGTINTYTSILRSFMTYIYNQGISTQDLSKRFSWLKTHLQPRYLRNDDIQKVISRSLQKTHGYRCHAIICFLLGTGCRVNELVNIRVQDFNVEEDFLFIRKGKGNKERYIPIYPKVRSVILDYLKITGVMVWNSKLDGYLFSHDYGEKRDKKLSVRSIQYMVGSIMKELGFEQKYTVHSFRHTFAVYCLKAGMKLHNLSLLLGHKDPKSTYVYIQLLPMDLRAEVTDKFPFPFEKLIQQVLYIKE